MNGCVVNYIDYEKDAIPLGNVYYPVSCKDVLYRDEKEFRLLFWKAALANQTYPMDDGGVKIAVDTDMLIENIYMNPSLDFDVSELRRAMEKTGLEREIKRSRIIM